MTSKQARELTILIDERVEAQRRFDSARRELDKAGVDLFVYIETLERMERTGAQEEVGK